MFAALTKTPRLDAKPVRAKCQLGIFSELDKSTESSGSLTRTLRLTPLALKPISPRAAVFIARYRTPYTASRNILKIRFPTFADLAFSAYLAASLCLPPRSFSTAEYAASLSAG